MKREEIMGSSTLDESIVSDYSGRDRIFRNVLFSWGGYLVILVAGFVLPRVIDRNVGQVQLGVWDFAWSLVHYLQFTSLGIGASVNRYVAKYRAGKEVRSLNDAVSSVFFLQVIAAAISAAIAVLAYFLVPSLMATASVADLDVAQSIVLLLGISISLTVAFNVFTGVITGLHRWDVHNIITSASHLLITVAMIVVLQLGGSLIEVSVAYLIGTALTQVARVYAAFRLCKELRISTTHISKTMLFKMLVFGGRALMVALPALLAVQTINVFVASSLGPAALTVLARPLALVRHVQTIVNKFAFVSTPIASSLQRQGDTQGLLDLVIQHGRWATAIAAPLLITIGVVGDKIVEVWMGPSYVNVPVIAALAAGFLLPVSQSPAYRILMGLNRHGRVAVHGTAASLIVFIIGISVLGITQFSLIGAAIVVGATITAAHGVVVMREICIALDIAVLRYLRLSMIPTLLNGVVLGIGLAIAKVFFLEPNLKSLSVVTLTGFLGFLGIQVALVDADLKRKLTNRIQGAWQSRHVTSVKESMPGRRRPLGTRNLLRRSFVWLCKYTGIARLFSYINRKKIRIVRFHGVFDSNRGDLWTPMRTQLSVQDFGRYIKHIKRRSNVISLNDAYEIIIGGRKFIPNSVVITFDDGYENNLTVAGPVLMKHGLPATIFVVTENVKSQIPFFWDRVDFNIQQLVDKNSSLNINGNEFKLTDDSCHDKRALYKQVSTWLRLSTSDDHEKRKIAEQFNVDAEQSTGKSLLEVYESDQYSKLLKVSQLSHALSCGFTIGSHTQDHVSLAAVSGETAKQQLYESKKLLDGWLSSECVAVAYPDGSVSDVAICAAKEVGYLCAVTTEPGLNSVGDNPFKLRRIHLGSNLSYAELDFQLSGLAAFLGRRFAT